MLIIFHFHFFNRDLFPGTLKKPAPFYAKTKISKLENHGDQGHPSLVKIDQWIKQVSICLLFFGDVVICVML